MKICVVDVETTGLRPDYDYLLEVGMVELDLESGNIRVIYNQLLREPGFGNPEKQAWIFQNSDLSYEDILAAPELDTLRGSIQTLLNRYPTTAFNSQFDFGFLQQRNFKIPHKLPCIMRVATSVVKIPKTWGSEPYKWPKAEEAWDFFFQGQVYREAHRAGDDAYHEAQILYAMYKQGKYRPEDEAWVKNHFCFSVW